jgi:Tol biopolymer transport system component
MLRCVVVSFLTLFLLQTAPPDTEIYLATFSTASGRVTIGPPVDISNNPGYDNQPSFTPDGRSVLFTSVRGARQTDPANSAASGSDIYRYDIESQQVTRVTDTPESEYSPIVTPDGTHFSTIRVEADGTQRL